MKDNEMWLIFFTGFEKTPIKIKENGQLKFDSIVTSSKHYPFMADAFKIRKDAIIEISTQSFSKPLILEPASMAGYKSVYISKARQKVEIHFTDSNKPITEQRKQDSILIAKFRRKSSRDLLKEVKDSITDSIYINKRQR
ncbi:MAG: hypothetical protein EOO46_06440 [Flavobacterium sp.]|nr:MAG: hypothetical protein EOO46_06440 [Flavobacterium sp.]